MQSALDSEHANFARFLKFFHHLGLLANRVEQNLKTGSDKIIVSLGTYILFPAGFYLKCQKNVKGFVLNF